MKTKYGVKTIWLQKVTLKCLINLKQNLLSC
jgi:hypothetical protein